MPNDNQLLPVELTSFSAVNIKSGVMLNWTTATEINNAGFEIERKSSNYNWKKIGFVRGNGNSTLPIKYSFADNSLNTGKYQYRLKQIDFNGSYKYSKIVEVNLSDIPVNYQLNQNYPNPFNPSTTISYSIPKASFVTIKIYDILGNEIAALVNQEKPAGKYEINFNAIHLSSGMYIYKLSAGNFNEMKKMILMK
jgi:5-hydroxyisourate hydrolase-like protein (transthyretin family)